MAMITTYKRGSNTGLDEEGGIRKKVKVECEVREDGTCEIRDADDTAEITLEGELLPESGAEVTTTTITTIETPEDHRVYMDDFAAHLIARKKSMLVPDEKLRAITGYLRTGTPLSPRLKFWLNLKKMMMVTLPELDLHDELVVPREGRDGSTTGLLRVVPVSRLYHLVSSLHNVQHAGYKKVKMVVDREYYGVPRSYVQAFCRTCPSCSKMQPLPLPLPPKDPPKQSFPKPPPQPVSRSRRPPRWGSVDRRMLGRSIQVDLLDMHHCPDGEFRHICHVMDHFSRFHFLFPLRSRSPGEVARGLEERVMAYMGPPRILHSSSDPKLVHKLNRILFGGWGSDTPFLGRTQNPHIMGGKGLDTNKIVLKQLARLRTDLYDSAAHFPWTTWLPRVMYCLNMHGAPATQDGQGQQGAGGSLGGPGTAGGHSGKQFPYQFMFGRMPPGRCPCWCEDRGHDTDQDQDQDQDQELDPDQDEDLDHDPEEEETADEDEDQIQDEDEEYEVHCLLPVDKTESTSASDNSDHC
ncbi:KRAB-A domain-containing protein 2 [Chionoecetes opilio]|uniref:KRAB-A domain-containing protein 2 n=1 Tax=Chionoecetes opilio TaxID=41210 RepID=A0A8J4XNK4_CHIOP|nr:KRAB-A domain-containing protein 2 [Chionoecetes opilio]